MDGALLQRDGGNRCSGAGLADDPRLLLRHHSRGGGWVRRVAVAGQHGRTNRLVLDLGLRRAQAHVHDVPWRWWGPVLLAGLVRGDVAGAVPTGDRRDTELLR